MARMKMHASAQLYLLRQIEVDIARSGRACRHIPVSRQVDHLNAQEQSVTAKN
jgi:hypothetical protein